MLNSRNALIVSAHADDETFGMGGTLWRLKENACCLHWVILTRVWEPKWSSDKVKKREYDIKQVSDFYGFSSVHRWQFPDNKLDTIALNDLQEPMIDLLEDIKPDTIFCPGQWDWNFEHRIAYEVVEMSVKPIYTPYLSAVYAYEIPSSTDWAFKGNRQFPATHYVSIEDAISKKLEACKLYTTELSEFPHSRSIEGISHIAATRGMECGKTAAEAFYAARAIF